MHEPQLPTMAGSRGVSLRRPPPAGGGACRLLHLMAAESESGQCWSGFFQDMLDRGRPAALYRA
ncbi:MAG: hypothetical protein ACOCX7_02330 [Bacteroidota bacterium]